MHDLFIKACPGIAVCVCVLRPGQKQSETIKCPGIGSTALIMVKELLYLAHVGMRLPFSMGLNLMSTAFNLTTDKVQLQR